MKPTLSLPVNASLADNSIRTYEDLTELDRFRVTGLARFRECPARWAAETTGKQSPSKGTGKKKDYSRMGTAVHHCVEALLRGEWNPDNDVQWNTWDSHLLKEGVCREERDNCRRYCQDMVDWQARHDVEAVEYEVVTGGDVLTGDDDVALDLVGHLDLLGWDKTDECFVIRDHKTNRGYEPVEVWRHALQPLLYTHLIRQLIGYQHPIRYEIGYVNLNCVVSWVTHPADEWAAVDVFRQIVGEEFPTYLRFGEFPERVNSYCYECPLFADCATAKGMVDDFAALAENGATDPTEGKGSLLQRYAYAKQVAELATACGDLVRAELQREMYGQEPDEETGTREFVDPEAGMKAVLSYRKGRTAPFSQVYKAVLEYIKAHYEPGYDELIGNLDRIFTVKVGELDRFAKDREELAMALVGVIKEEVGSVPTLTVRRFTCPKKEK